jgi:hypothetical protein
MSKDKYKVKNWSEYNEGLKHRGSLCLWIEAGIAEQWRYKGEKKRGGQSQYSEMAIELCCVIGKVYHLPLRQAYPPVENFCKLNIRNNYRKSKSD